ncbi:hypothetical protein [Accumulibacter sp.]|uniref:hypothetical protein n=1 Tax=Accumulibacter sp. TaxID=2053492 RepID=UPI002C145F72|nr:hypothetical protein [Accumulibacter sp.]HNC20253.1 hypothetical protein [Accumulibacter sp.]
MNIVTVGIDLAKNVFAAKRKSRAKGAGLKLVCYTNFKEFLSRAPFSGSVFDHAFM